MYLQSCAEQNLKIRGMVLADQLPEMGSDRLAGRLQITRERGYG